MNVYNTCVYVQCTYKDMNVVTCVKTFLGQAPTHDNIKTQPNKQAVIHTLMYCICFQLFINSILLNTKGNERQQKRRETQVYA